MSTESTSGVTPAEIYAYFDDELAADRAELVSKALADEPSLRAEHDQLGGLRSTLRASLEAEAQAVPAARFEQIWDEIDRAIERDARLQAEADKGSESVWTRLWAALRPVRYPVLAAAAAAAVTLIVVNTGSDEPNNSPAIASVDEEPAPTPQPEAEAPAPEPTRLAEANPELPQPSTAEPEPALAPMPVPESSEVEIHGIEFGGSHGSISNTGTVTVLYVEEDEESTNSERSL